MADQLAGGVAGLGERAVVFRADIHRVAVVEQHDGRGLRGAEQRVQAGQHRSGHGQREQGGDQAAHEQQEQLFDADPPPLRALAHLQELHRRPLDHAEPAAVQQVDQQRDAGGGDAEQKYDVEKCHAAQEWSEGVAKKWSGGAMGKWSNGKTICFCSSVGAQSCCAQCVLRSRRWVALACALLAALRLAGLEAPPTKEFATGVFCAAVGRVTDPAHPATVDCASNTLWAQQACAATRSA